MRVRDCDSLRLISIVHAEKLNFHFSSLQFYSFLPSPSIGRRRCNHPRRREIGLVKIAAWKLLFAFQLLSCRPPDLQNTWRFHGPAQKPAKDAFCDLCATSTKAASLGLNSFMGFSFAFLVRRKLLPLLCGSLSPSQPPLGWGSAILIHFTAKFHSSSLDRKWRIPHSLLEVSQKLN